MSAHEQSIEDLEAAGNLTCLRREWLAERVAQVLGAALLIAGVLGLFGRGPLTWMQATSDDGSLTVDYYTTERYESDSELRLTIHRPASEMIRLKIDRAFLDVTTPNGIWPPPLKTETIGNALVCTFQLGTGQQEQEVVYYYQHETYGVVKYQVSVDGGEPVNVSQFVFP
jgi:hypothetical protein